MAIVNRRWVLQKRPSGMVAPDDFALVVEDIDDTMLAEGEYIVRVQYVSFDPAMRGWIEDKPSYLPPVGLGETMRAAAVGSVALSNNSDYPVGGLVHGMLGWQEYALCGPKDFIPAQLLPEGTPATLPLTLFGATSATAYFGLLDVGKPQPGETVLVSGAAGATGSIVAQIGKIKGCRVIGIAGGDEKCQWLKDACGVDDVIDYKLEDISTRLASLCPEGIDVFFDNVGGDTLEAAIEHISDHGRIVLCGAISGYNEVVPGPGPKNLMNLIARRVRMEGFIVLDYMDRFEECMTELGQWLAEGKIAYREDIQSGFENIPATLMRLFSGENQGKQILSLSQD